MGALAHYFATDLLSSAPSYVRMCHVSYRAVMAAPRDGRDHELLSIHNSVIFSQLGLTIISASLYVLVPHYLVSLIYPYLLALGNIYFLLA